ncbi:trypsin-like peptidase domain-containing protein [Granulicella cerasi]|uniref:trypsin-like peptidase domain-containing protein n=1 Tax=Granulicella cerasi TaxID=741063 RepID=UPI0021E0C312|nr:trypsin-like peptidase domain-containing protein [Granulicella cerasi]
MSSPKHPFTSFWTNIRSGRLTTTFTVLGALSVGVLAGSLLTGRVHGAEQKASDAKPLTIPSPVTLSNGFSTIVKQVEPAVVNINTESTPKPASKRRGGRNMPVPNGGDDDDQQNDMQDFFNKFFGGQNPNGDGDATGGTRRALGSGFIVDQRGYIITNNHVVDKADHIYVKLSSDPENPLDPGRPATVVGTDKDTDIAVIKIDPKGMTLPTVKLGNSDGPQVGDWVLAIGSPFGLSHTVSAGIISAKNRSIDEGPDANGVSKNQFQRFIQTDAAINPGNSGGPLVDMSGSVIGMNTAIYTQSAGSEGVGFAMPSNILINVYNMLIGPSHKVTRGSIGIQFQANQSSAVGRMYGFANGGVMVSAVTPNMPAAKAGLQPNDIIVTIDGKPVKDGDELVSIISAKTPGSTVKIGYLRNGKQESAEVGIADRAKLFDDLDKSDSSNNAPDDSDAGQAGQAKLGITVSAVPAPMASKLGLKNGGVVVTAVRPGSFADEVGLTRTAVITEINRHAVTDVSSYRSIVSNLKSGDDVVFVVRAQTGGGSNFIGGTLP